MPEEQLREAPTASIDLTDPEERAAPPPPFPTPAAAPDSSGESGRNFGKWMVGFFFLLAMLALLVALPLFQVTAAGPAKQTLRRATAALTEIDPLIDRNYDDLQQSAAAAAPGETLELKDYPIAVPLTREEVLGASKQQIRDLLLDRSADVMYEQGTAPLRESTGSKQHVGRFTIGGIADHGLGFLRNRNHDILAGVTFALAALCGVLAVSLACLCRGFGRLASVGGVVLVASMPLVVGGIAARLYMRIASEGNTEYIQKEFLSIGQALAWIPIRDGLAFVALGASFLAVGFAGARWADRRASPHYTTQRRYAR